MPKKPHMPAILKRAAKSTFAKPATEQYPFKQLQLQSGFRGQPILDMSRCISCGACCRNCPVKAIEMVLINGKKYPQFNLGKCIFCHQCVDICPKKAITRSPVFELATTDKSALIIKPQLKSPPQKPEGNTQAAVC